MEDPFITVRIPLSHAKFQVVHWVNENSPTLASYYEEGIVAHTQAKQERCPAANEHHWHTSGVVYWAVGRTLQGICCHCGRARDETAPVIGGTSVTAQKCGPYFQMSVYN